MSFFALEPPSTCFSNKQLHLIFLLLMFAYLMFMWCVADEVMHIFSGIVKCEPKSSQLKEPKT